MVNLLMLVMMDPDAIVWLLDVILGGLATAFITYVFKAIDHAMGVGPRRKGRWGL